MASLLVKASLAAAAPVALSQSMIYGIFGVIAGPFSGLFTFALAACLASPFLKLRPKIREPYYFVLHLVGGYLAGVLLTFLDPQADTYGEVFLGREVSLPLIASLSAWAYLFLFNPDSSGASTDSNSVRSGHMSLYCSVPIFVVCVFGLSFLPGSRPYSEDEACDNVLRGQLPSNAPLERIRLTLPEGDEAKLKRYYAEFAFKHQLQSKGHAIHTTSAQTSMCNERVTFKAGGFFEGRHGISVFEMSPNSEWQELTEELVCGLKERWPDSLKFSDDGGQKHDLPLVLKAHCYLEG